MKLKINVLSIFLLILLLFPFTQSAKEKRAFTIDDLYRVKSVSGIHLSPDGKNLLFTVREDNLKKAKSDTNVYIMDVATHKTRQLTYHKGADFSPSWSPDGNKIYFLSTREGGSQLWEMDVRGGEARQVSNFHTGVSSPQALGNGKIIFTSTVFPECMTDNDCNKKHAEKLAEGPVQAHIADNLLYRHWNFYRDNQYTHLFILDPETQKVEAVTKGKADYPAFSFAGKEFDVSPDGKLLCLATHQEKNDPHSTNSDLFLLDLTAKEAKLQNLTDDNNAYDGVPVFSPDGKYILYLTQKIPGYESDKRRLALLDLETKTSKVITDSIDNWVETFKWSHDSRYIYFTVHELGYYPLYRYDLKKSKIQKIIDKQTIWSFELTPDGRNVIYRRSTVDHPTELWSCKFGKKNIYKQVTHFNRELEQEVDIRPAEQLWVEGSGGKKIHVFLVKPHNFDPDKKYPLIMNIHGGPQMQWADSYRGDWQVYPGAGYIVAFPNPHGSTGYGQEFTKAISRDWNGKVIDDIDMVAAHLAKLPYVDGERMGAMGWSWGGYAVMWLEGHNKHFKALASMMGVYDLRSMYSCTEELWFPRWDIGAKPWDDPELYAKMSPSSYVKNFKTPCLVITGERDYRVPYSQSLAFFTDLQEMGVPSQLIVFKNDGHWPSGLKSMPVYYNAHLEWFHKYLKGGKAPYCTHRMIRNCAYDDCKDDCKKDCKEKK